jgi:hypothetical protein
LDGHGQVVLSDDDGNVISGTMTSVTFTNVDNTISGAGQLGNGQMTLVNEGVINASGSHALVVDTGDNVIVNTGTLEATGSGGLVVQSGVDNSGSIEANGGNVTIVGAVTGTGSAAISGQATLEFDAASSANVNFAVDAEAALRFATSSQYTGTVSGFDGNDHIDLMDIGFGAGTALAYTANQDGSGGVLSVTDGGHAASIALLGQYDAAGFEIATDNAGGTLVRYDHLV